MTAVFAVVGAEPVSRTMTLGTNLSRDEALRLRVLELRWRAGGVLEEDLEGVFDEDPRLPPPDSVASFDFRDDVANEGGSRYGPAWGVPPLAPYRSCNFFKLFWINARP